MGRSLRPLLEGVKRFLPRRLRWAATTAGVLVVLTVVQGLAIAAPLAAGPEFLNMGDAAPFLLEHMNLSQASASPGGRLPWESLCVALPLIALLLVVGWLLAKLKTWPAWLGLRRAVSDPDIVTMWLALVVGPGLIILNDFVLRPLSSVGVLSWSGQRWLNSLGIGLLAGGFSAALPLTATRRRRMTVLGLTLMALVVVEVGLPKMLLRFASFDPADLIANAAGVLLVVAVPRWIAQKAPASDDRLFGTVALAAPLADQPGTFVGAEALTLLVVGVLAMAAGKRGGSAGGQARETTSASPPAPDLFSYRQRTFIVSVPPQGEVDLLQRIVAGISDAEMQELMARLPHAPPPVVLPKGDSLHLKTVARQSRLNYVGGLRPLAQAGIVPATLQSSRRGRRTWYWVTRSTAEWLCDLIPLSEAAALLGESRRTILQWLKERPEQRAVWGAVSLYQKHGYPSGWCVSRQCISPLIERHHRRISADQAWDTLRHHGVAIGKVAFYRLIRKPQTILTPEETVAIFGRLGPLWDAYYRLDLLDFARLARRIQTRWLTPQFDPLITGPLLWDDLPSDPDGATLSTAAGQIGIDPRVLHRKIREGVVFAVARPRRGATALSWRIPLAEVRRVQRLLDARNDPQRSLEGLGIRVARRWGWHHGWHAPTARWEVTPLLEESRRRYGNEAMTSELWDQVAWSYDHALATALLDLLQQYEDAKDDVSPTSAQLLAPLAARIAGTAKDPNSKLLKAGERYAEITRLRRPSSPGGRWASEQVRYDETETRWRERRWPAWVARLIGQAWVPTWRESVRFVFAGTALTVGLLYWAFGVPLAIGPPVWGVVSAFLAIWIGRHLLDRHGHLLPVRAWPRVLWAPLVIAGLTALTLWLGDGVAHHPSGFGFFGLLLGALVLPHLAVSGLLLLLPFTLTVPVADAHVLEAGREIALALTQADGTSATRTYRVEAQAGQGGGFGEGWRMTDVATDQAKFVKLFRTHGLRRFIRDAQYFAAFQDRFGPQYYGEVARQLLYNHRFLEIATRALGGDQPDFVPLDGCAWVPQAGAYALVMPYEALRDDYLELQVDTPSPEFAEKVERMRQLMSLFEEAGAGNLRSQIGINPEGRVRWAWFALQNMLRRVSSGRLVLLDPDRNIGAFYGGFTLPGFFFAVFQDAVRHARARGLAPDAFHLMDMDRFEWFLTDHPDLLTAEEATQMGTWIADYRGLTRTFLSHTPRTWRPQPVLQMMRYNNIDRWVHLYREMDETRAGTLRTSLRAYLAYFGWRILRRLPRWTMEAGLALAGLVVRCVEGVWSVAWWPVRLCVNAVRFLVSTSYRERATRSVFFTPLETAVAQRQIAPESDKYLRAFYDEHAQRFPVYLRLYLWHLLPKFLEWPLRLLGIGEIFSTGQRWDLLFFSFAVPALYRSVVTLLVMWRHPDVDLRLAFWISLVPIIGGYLAVPLQMLAASEAVKPWFVLKTRLAVQHLVRRFSLPGFGEPGGLLQQRAQSYLANPLVRMAARIVRYRVVVIFGSALAATLFFYIPVLAGETLTLRYAAVLAVLAGAGLVEVIASRPRGVRLLRACGTVLGYSWRLIWRNPRWVLPFLALFMLPSIAAAPLEKCLTLRIAGEVSGTFSWLAPAWLVGTLVGVGLGGGLIFWGVLRGRHGRKRRAASEQPLQSVAPMSEREFIERVGVAIRGLRHGIGQCWSAIWRLAVALAPLLAGLPALAAGWLVLRSGPFARGWRGIGAAGGDDPQRTNPQQRRAPRRGRTNGDHGATQGRATSARWWVWAWGNRRQRMAGVQARVRAVAGRTREWSRNVSEQLAWLARLFHAPPVRP